MAPTVSQLLKSDLPIESFREAVRALDGAFSFSREDMEALGAAYLALYPDSFSNRNVNEVQYGYQLVRICVAEKMLEGESASVRDAYRAMFASIGAIETEAPRLAASLGRERALERQGIIEGRLNEVKGTIDSMPAGMIKERYVGGIAHLYNICYLIRSALAR